MPNEVLEHHITVPRTARYFVIGDPDRAADVWFVCHGYGQLAARFLDKFRTFMDAGRCLVAPEGLSRFYLSDSPAERRVGASWMTREDRLHEIADYVKYLDAVHAAVVPRAGVRRVAALGFSQGAATASRWAGLGTSRLDDLVLWGGELPPDLDLALAAERLRKMRVTLVAGTGDGFITSKVLSGIEQRLEEHAVPYRAVIFEGGHEIDAAVLQRLAGGS